jgi:hypothetical protein
MDGGEAYLSIELGSSIPVCYQRYSNSVQHQIAGVM